jgi:hypothetical protein
MVRRLPVTAAPPLKYSRAAFHAQPTWPVIRPMPSVFAVVGDDTDHQFVLNKPKLGLCFLPLGELPIGDVMLSQKIALESCESRALAVARRFAPNGFVFRRSRPLR